MGTHLTASVRVDVTALLCVYSLFFPAHGLAHEHVLMKKKKIDE